MSENKKGYGFTLVELLTAVVIIGIVATISFSSLFEGIYKNTFSTDLKNSVINVQHIANVQMATKGTKDLNLTDFSSPSKLFSDKNFMTVKKCSASEAKENCWEGKDNYKNVNGSDIAIESDSESIILKNGQIISYKNSAITVNEPDVLPSKAVKTVGKFCTDLNGVKEKPNRIGRDYFCYYIDEKGRIVGSGDFGTNSVETNISNCKSSSGTPESCFDAVMQSGWKIDY